MKSNAAERAKSGLFPGDQSTAPTLSPDHEEEHQDFLLDRGLTKTLNTPLDEVIAYLESRPPVDIKGLMQKFKIIKVLFDESDPTSQKDTGTNHKPQNDKNEASTNRKTIQKRPRQSSSESTNPTSDREFRKTIPQLIKVCAAQRQREGSGSAVSKKRKTAQMSQIGMSCEEMYEDIGLWSRVKRS